MTDSSEQNVTDEERDGEIEKEIQKETDRERGRVIEKRERD